MKIFVVSLRCKWAEGRIVAQAFYSKREDAEEHSFCEDGYIYDAEDYAIEITEAEVR